MHFASKARGETTWNKPGPGTAKTPPLTRPFRDLSLACRDKFARSGLQGIMPRNGKLEAECIPLAAGKTGLGDKQNTCTKMRSQDHLTRGLDRFWHPIFAYMIFVFY